MTTTTSSLDWMGISQAHKSYLFHLWYCVSCLNASVEDADDGRDKLVQGSGVMRTYLINDQIQSEQWTSSWTENLTIKIC